MERTDWDGLPSRTKKAIERRTGLVRSAATVTDGKNSALTSVLETEVGRIFVKGIRVDDPCVITQAREVAVAPYVRGISPRILWQVKAGDWDVIGFEYIEATHADYSVDLVAVADVMRRLGSIHCPDLPILKRAETRWRDYFEDHSDAGCLVGATLLHTDWNPTNVLIVDGRAMLIDWAWPTLGAPWIDPACWTQRLIVAGHDVESAERCARTVPAWHMATDWQINAFAVANARLWDGIVASEPAPFKTQMRSAAHAWANFRQRSHLMHTQQHL